MCSKVSREHKRTEKTMRFEEQEGKPGSILTRFKRNSEDFGLYSKKNRKLSKGFNRGALMITTVFLFLFF